MAVVLRGADASVETRGHVTVAIRVDFLKMTAQWNVAGIPCVAISARAGIGSNAAATLGTEALRLLHASCLVS